MLIDNAKKGELGKVIELHKQGACLLATDEYNMTSLHHAARFGHRDIVKYLLDKGQPLISAFSVDKINFKSRSSLGGYLRYLLDEGQPQISVRLLYYHFIIFSAFTIHVYYLLQAT